MKLKANLHLHTKDDIENNTHKNIVVDYDLFQALDKAKELKFDIIAATCHNFVITDKKYYDYAKKLGIFLIPGIEKTIEKKHVLILNAGKEAEQIKTFQDLKNYKQTHPEIFVIAPHPFFFTSYSLGEKLLKNIELFDAIEYSWFYFKFLNLNKKAEKVAQKFNLPLIATSDTHNLNLLDKSYIVIDIDELSFEAIKDSLIKRKYENISHSAKLLSWDTWNWHPSIKRLQNFFSSKNK